MLVRIKRKGAKAGVPAYSGRPGLTTYRPGRPEYAGTPAFALLRLIFICSAVFLPLSAQVYYPKEMRQAEAYLDAKEYKLAKEAYENLLQLPLEQWQRSVIMYNLGNVWLSAGEWEEALTIFNSISLDNILEPVLKERIERNIMLTYMREGQFLEQNHDYKKAAEMEMKGIDKAPVVDRAFCHLQRAEGVENCETSYAAVLMNNIARHFLAKILSEEQVHQLDAMNARQDAELLLKGMNEAVFKTDFILTHSIPKDLANVYNANFDKEFSDWNPVWTDLKSKIEKIKDNKEILEIFNKAEDQYSKGLREFQKGGIEGSKSFFQTAAKLLEVLIEKLPKPPPSGGGEKKENAPSSQEKKEKQEPSQTQANEADDQVLQLLLEMEQDDRKPKPSQKIRKSELRPW